MAVCDCTANDQGRKSDAAKMMNRPELSGYAVIAIQIRSTLELSDGKEDDDS